MNRIPFYKSFEDKEAVFNVCKTTTSRKEIEEFLETPIKKGEWIFRGMGNASYKMYNSAQRFWLNNSLEVYGYDYHSMNKSLIDIFLKSHDNVFKKYLNNLGISEKDDFAILSFMQHYGGATPFLDFTHNFLKAVFFAARYYEPVHNNEWGDFISIYSVNDRVFKELFNMKKGAEKYLKDDACYIEYEYNLIPEFKIIYIGDDRGYSRIPYRLHFNFNIINQEGAFIASGSPDLPLAEYIQEFVIKGLEEEQLPKESTSSYINCINIHKSHVPFILDYLDNKHQINHEMMFPDPERIALNTTKSFLIEKNSVQR